MILAYYHAYGFFGLPITEFLQRSQWQFEAISYTLSVELEEGRFLRADGWTLEQVASSRSSIANF